MSTYETDPEVKAYIDERLKIITEEINPILEARDGTANDVRACVKREKKLKIEIKKKDKQFFLDNFEV